MAESAWLPALLAVMTGCLMLMTAAILLTARDLRRLFRRLEAVLPSCDRAVREAHRVLAQLRALLDTAQLAAQALETAVGRASGLAAHVRKRWTQVARATRAWLRHPFGTVNGTRGEPRRHARSS